MNEDKNRKFCETNKSKIDHTFVESSQSQNLVIRVTI